MDNVSNQVTNNNQVADNFEFSLLVVIQASIYRHHKKIHIIEL